MWQKIPNDHLVDCVQTEPLFTATECEQIIALPGEYQFSTVTDEQGHDLRLDAMRQAQVKHILANPENHWLLERIWHAFSRINHSIFQFRLDQTVTGTQIIHYPEGGHYDWHTDIGPATYSFRKLSMVVFLSDPNTYEGGKLQVHRLGFNQQQGTAIVFPAYLLHRVEPVTKGHRYALATWAEGFCFR